MKKFDPATIRRALYQRFPRWTQRFFTWLTAIAPPGDPMPRRPWTDADHVTALVMTWLIAAGLASLTNLGQQAGQPPMA